MTYVDATTIIIDNADEYELQKFRASTSGPASTRSRSSSSATRWRPGQIIADGASTVKGELAIGKNVLVAFNTFDGYNFEDAIVINERLLVKDDVFTSIHIEDFDVEIRETKLGREEFTRDIPNVSEKMLSQPRRDGIIRIGARVGRATSWSARSAPKSQERADAGREAAARDLRSRR